MFTSTISSNRPTSELHKFPEFRLLSYNPYRLVRAFKIYIRPILEYASTTWSPSYIRQINLLESVQRNFTQRIPGCSHMSYPHCLAFLNLQTLEHCRLIADLIMCFNIVKGKNCIDQTKFFRFTAFEFSRGYPYKLSIPLAKLRSSFAQALLYWLGTLYQLKLWLPNQLPLSNTVSAFKHCVCKIDLTIFHIFQTDTL